VPVWDGGLRPVAGFIGCGEVGGVDLILRPANPCKLNSSIQRKLSSKTRYQDPPPGYGTATGYGSTFGNGIGRSLGAFGGVRELFGVLDMAKG